LTPNLKLKVIPNQAFSRTGLTSIVIPATIRIIEMWAFDSCEFLTEVLWAEGSKIKVIEQGAFQDTKLKKLVIPGSLQYIGARMCPETTELLLTTESMTPKFEKWKASFMANRWYGMGTRTGHEMEDGEKKEEEDGEEDGSKSTWRCAVM
jgi:hypothetical protein